MSLRIYQGRDYMAQPRLVHVPIFKATKANLRSVRLFIIIIAELFLFTSPRIARKSCVFGAIFSLNPFLFSWAKDSTSIGQQYMCSFMGFFRIRSNSIKNGVYIIIV